MFHFADFASHYGISGLLQKGCPIRTPPDRWLFAPPRSFSPLAASFFAVRYLRHSLYALIFSFFHFIDTLYSVVNMLRVICLYSAYFMVEMIGFEPTTYGLQSHRSPTEPHPHVILCQNGGPRGIRTSDLAVISRVL